MPNSIHWIGVITLDEFLSFQQALLLRRYQAYKAAETYVGCPQNKDIGFKHCHSAYILQYQLNQIGCMTKCDPGGWPNQKNTVSAHKIQCSDRQKFMWQWWNHYSTSWYLIISFSIVISRHLLLLLSHFVYWVLQNFVLYKVTCKLWCWLSV